uniref:Uncharacterized protein n=1 Tax=Romanomermis culicivorax TaxID=13658 RepID=A0A915IX19_ROMCU
MIFFARFLRFSPNFQLPNFANFPEPTQEPEPEMELYGSLILKPGPQPGLEPETIFFEIKNPCTSIRHPRSSIV